MNRMIRTLFCTVVVAAACSGLFAKDAGKCQIIVLDTNDTHGAVLAAKDGTGGFAAEATFVKQMRAENKNVLLLHAGDVNIGSALSNMFNAEPDIRCLNAIGYDAVTLGNHEFDGTLEKLQKQISMSKFPWISANVMRNGSCFVKPYIIKTYDGVRVAVIGLTTLRTISIARPDASLVFDDEIQTARNMVKLVRSKEHADIVIICGHLGDIEEAAGHETSIKVAKDVPGIDLIVDGHTHSFFAEPKIVNGVPIVTANVYGRYVGKGVMTIENRKMTGFSWTPVEINEKTYPPDPSIVSLLEPYIKEADASLDKVVLTTAAPFDFGDRRTRYQEMASGDVLCDAMMSYCSNMGIHTDCAIINGGSIRSGLPQGAVTRRDILTMLPFDNTMYVCTLKGSDVLDLFKFIGSIHQGAGGWAQVSKEISYTITYDAAGDGTMSGLTIGGSPVDPAKTYRIVTNDYMASGKDGYTAFTTAVDRFDTSMLFGPVFIDYVKSFKGSFTPAVGKRITVVNGK